MFSIINREFEIWSIESKIKQENYKLNDNNIIKLINKFLPINITDITNTNIDNLKFPCVILVYMPDRCKYSKLEKTKYIQHNNPVKLKHYICDLKEIYWKTYFNVLYVPQYLYMLKDDMTSKPYVIRSTRLIYQKK